jgi:hypothetical protein
MRWPGFSTTVPAYYPYARNLDMSHDPAFDMYCLADSSYYCKNKYFGNWLSILTIHFQGSETLENPFAVADLVFTC